MEVENGCLSNIGFLSIRVIFLNFPLPWLCEMWLFYQWGHTRDDRYIVWFKGNIWKIMISLSLSLYIYIYLYKWPEFGSVDFFLGELYEHQFTRVLKDLDVCYINCSLNLDKLVIASNSLLYLCRLASFLNIAGTCMNSFWNDKMTRGRKERTIIWEWLISQMMV